VWVSAHTNPNRTLTRRNGSHIAPPTTTTNVRAPSDKTTEASQRGPPRYLSGANSRAHDRAFVPKWLRPQAPCGEIRDGVATSGMLSNHLSGLIQRLSYSGAKLAVVWWLARGRAHTEMLAVGSYLETPTQPDTGFGSEGMGSDGRYPLALRRRVFGLGV